jgi:hypothetical protein
MAESIVASKLIPTKWEISGDTKVRSLNATLSFPGGDPTVAELIAALLLYPQDATAYVYEDWSNHAPKIDISKKQSKLLTVKQIEKESFKREQDAALHLVMKNKMDDLRLRSLYPNLKEKNEK